MNYREFLEDAINDVRDSIEVDGDIVPAVRSGHPDNWTPDESWCDILLPSDWRVKVSCDMVDVDEGIDLDFQEEFGSYLVLSGVLYLDVVSIDTEGFEVVFGGFNVEDMEEEEDDGYDGDCYDYDCEPDCGDYVGWKDGWD